MIKSILDNDLYKLTMQQAVHVLYPRAQVRYTFIDRAGTIFPDGFAKRLTSEIEKMSSLCLQANELRYLEDTCYFLTPVYLDFLNHYRYDPGEVTVEMENGKLKVDIEGPWYRTMLWEVPLLATISELYFKMTRAKTLSSDECRVKNILKGELLRDGQVDFADFGTRRRFSSANQETVLRDILSVAGNSLVGTSNVYLSKLFGIKPIGTHAHEWFMFHGAVHGYRRANQASIDAWTSVFHGHLGIALTDTYTTDAFLTSFDAVKARLFDGVRQDSGDPIEFADKLIAHYRKLRINPLHKTIVFSDGLDVDTAISINDYCRNKIIASFGIGTYLTNDIGPKSLNMVIKLSECKNSVESDWIPVVKLSDTLGKHTGNPDEIDLCKRTI